MKRATCQAIAEHGRIQLIIGKNEPGYKAFSKVLTAIAKTGCTSWYGDVTTAEGIETSGLVITAK